MDHKRVESVVSNRGKAKTACPAGTRCSTFAGRLLGRCREMAKLSNFELDIMSCFWERKQLSAPQVHKLLGVERGVTYSTIKSLIDRLEAKVRFSLPSPGRVILPACH